MKSPADGATGCSGPAGWGRTQALMFGGSASRERPGSCRGVSAAHFFMCGAPASPPASRHRLRACPAATQRDGPPRAPDRSTSRCLMPGSDSRCLSSCFSHTTKSQQGLKEAFSFFHPQLQHVYTEHHPRDQRSLARSLAGCQESWTLLPTREALRGALQPQVARAI